MGVRADELHRVCGPPERFIPDQHDGRPGRGAKREQKLTSCVFHSLAIHDVVIEMCFAEALCFHLWANIAVGRGRHVPLDYRCPCATMTTSTRKRSGHAGTGQTRMHHGHAQPGHAGTNAYDAGFSPLVQSKEWRRHMHVGVRHGHGCKAGQAGAH